ncbi:hypothetical protein NPIL_444281 [Nephila pilipes]|uniref:Uncharacterized protein n=1 Tax=Nephila pilipes TaxID=299642 RepID=A0A8X6N731_NEPPI|nr:hypothetical protein NPIL_444281 [Nephila pilipes]
MAQIRAEEAAEQHAARLEDARLRGRSARQSRSATSNVLRSQQREHNRLQMAERRQQGKAYQPYNRLGFRYNPAEKQKECAVPLEQLNCFNLENHQRH